MPNTQFGLTMSDSIQYYITTKSRSDGYRGFVYCGFVYKYDQSGNNEIPVHTCRIGHSDEAPAIDDAVEWCQQKELDYEVDI